MATRHKAVKATLDKGYASEWNDDHHSDYSTRKDHRCFMVGVNLGAHWDFAQTTAAANPSMVFVDHHEFAEIDSLVAGPTITSMRHEFSAAPGNITHNNNNPIMTTRIWVVSHHTVGEVAEWGLQKSEDTPFAANKDGAYFRIKAGVLEAVTQNDAVETATDVTPAGGIPEFAQYSIALTPTNCKFYIDDLVTPVATHTTNIPDEDLTMKYSTQVAAANQTEIRTDCVFLSRLVYKG